MIASRHCNAQPLPLASKKQLPFTALPRRLQRWLLGNAKRGKVVKADGQTAAGRYELPDDAAASHAWAAGTVLQLVAGRPALRRRRRRSLPVLAASERDS